MVLMGLVDKDLTIYRGENSAEEFLSSLLHEPEELDEKLTEVKPMQLSP